MNIRTPQLNPVVAALPGAGWAAAYREDDGTEYVEPIVAWLIHADGEMDPICVGIDGSNDDATTASNFLRLISPTSAAMALAGMEPC